MNDIKQVIVIRKDLNMRKGKMCAQAAHASLKVFFDRMIKDGHGVYACEFTGDMKLWMEGGYKKIVVSVDSEDELVLIFNKAIDAGLPCALIEDSGYTEFNGVVTKTAVAIGPGASGDMDPITGGLKLL